MPPKKSARPQGKRYALCIGVGSYTDPSMENRNLRYAPKDAEAIAEVLRDPKRGAFEPEGVALRVKPEDTTEPQLRKAINNLLNGPDRQPEDLALIFISGHGGVFGNNHTFYLYPSDAQIEPGPEVRPNLSTVLDVFGLASLINEPKVKNVIIWLDVCHAGGAAETVNILGFNRTSKTNLFIVGAARHDQTAEQSGALKHGVFTDCLLEAFRQKPDHSDGWLTVSEIQSFIERKIQESDEVKKFPATVQAQELFIYPLVQNPAYSIDNQKFYQEVRELLKLDGYRPDNRQETPEAPFGYYVTSWGEGRQRQRWGILIYDNDVVITSLDFIESVGPFLKEQLESEVDKIMIVTNRQLETKTQTIFRDTASGRSRFQFDTRDNILNTLVNFESFLERWRKEYEEEHRVSQEPPVTLSKVYIPLRAEKRQYKELTAEKDDEFALRPILRQHWKRDEETSEPYKVVKVAKLDIFIQEWLADEKRSRLALLGNYGTGKFTFSLHLTAQLIKQQDQPGNRIPIYVPLRLFAEPIPKLKRLTEYVADEGGTTPPNLEALKKMAAYNGLGKLDKEWR